MFDSLAVVRESLEALTHTRTADDLDDADARRAVRELAAIRRLVDALLLTTGRRVGAESLADALHVSAREARTTVDTATRLEQLPATSDAVREGRLSIREAALIAEAAGVNPNAEHDLLAAATLGRVPLRDACIAARAVVEDASARARRQHSLRSLRTWTDADGMLAGHFRLVPEVGGRVKAALDAEMQHAFRRRRRDDEREPLDALGADALTALVLERSDAGRRIGTVVHVLIDHGALMRGGAAEGEVCEIPGVGPVNATWVRELLGSAFLTAVIKHGKNIMTVAHLGRHIPAEVRTALVVSGRECDVDGCHQRGYLECDHERQHARGGPTAFWNLGWLCYRHHRLKSSGWMLGPRDPATRKRTLRPPPARAA